MHTSGHPPIGNHVNRRQFLARMGWSTAGMAALTVAGSRGRVFAQAASQYPEWLPISTKPAKRGGTLTRASAWDPPVLDPRLTQSIGLYQFAGLTSNRLVRYVFPDEASGVNDLILKGDLAESWQSSPDFRVWTFKLRQGVKWHNKAPVSGRTLDADDVLFSWRRFAAKNSGRINVANVANPDAPVLSITASDPSTLVMKLKEPLVYALGLFHPSGASGVIISPKETDSTFDARGDMIGTGPWVMEKYTPSLGYTFKRNPEYWDKDTALMDQIDMPIIPEYTTALSQLKAGNIYWMGPTATTNIKPEDALPLKQQEPRIGLYQSELAIAGLVGSRLNFGWLPAGKSPFLDERVRQAVSMAWDRDLYMDTFFNVAKFGSEGIPVAFECTGSTIALQEAIRIVKRRGLVVGVGFYQGEGKGLWLGDEFHHNGIRVACGQIGNIHPSTDWQGLRARSIELAQRGAVRFGGLPRLKVPVERVADGFDALGRPAEVLQVALTYEAD
jgi:ABC-type transport system substrate-binding protein